LTLQLQNATWEKAELESILTAAATEAGIGFGKLAQPLRAALAGRTATPSVYDMMLVIGRDETIARLSEAAD
jgi:glutamyl-tRNA synthetase